VKASEATPKPLGLVFCNCDYDVFFLFLHVVPLSCCFGVVGAISVLHVVVAIVVLLH
jgi:hypothetical protein